MKPFWEEHTFALCAYQESPYLEECIQSLLKQRMKSCVCICTSTPNDYIRNLAMAYELPLYINLGKSGIGEDWNFAVSCAKTPYVTLAHQDDIYKESYTWEMRKALKKAKHPLILFSDYGELRQGEIVEKNRLLRVKRLLLFPLKGKFLQKSRFIRRRVLSMGNPVCCPSVTLAIDNLSSPIFVPGMRSNLDWDAWERFSRLEGEFVYVSSLLLYHRIHQDSETSAIIGDGRRTQEDYELFRRFWPCHISRLLGKVYKKSENSNKAS